MCWTIKITQVHLEQFGEVWVVHKIIEFQTQQGIRRVSVTGFSKFGQELTTLKMPNYLFF